MTSTAPVNAVMCLNTLAVAISLLFRRVKAIHDELEFAVLKGQTYLSSEWTKNRQAGWQGPDVFAVFVASAGYCELRISNLFHPLAQWRVSVSNHPGAPGLFFLNYDVMCWRIYLGLMDSV